MLLIWHKLRKFYRCLQWSTFCVIIYIFLFGLIIHAITYKLRNGINNNQQQKFKFKKLQMENSMLNLLSATTAVTQIKTQKLTSINMQNRLTGIETETVTQPKTNTVVTKQQKLLLMNAFRKADKNQDAKITLIELADYIHHKINAHINEAIKLNPRDFRRTDISPADGLITWEEYHSFFLQENGLTEADIDEKGDSRNRRARELLARDRMRWSEVARTDLFSLTIDEFMSFRHPESSTTNLLAIVEDVLRQLDLDGDDMLTLEEFSDVDMNDDVELMQKILISKTVPQRQQEFKYLIDHNKDGKADRRELLHYVDPKTKRYALREAENIFSLCDDNHDGLLKFNELYENSDIIFSSKMINTAKNFHTNF